VYNAVGRRAGGKPDGPARGRRRTMAEWEASPSTDEGRTASATCSYRRALTDYMGNSAGRKERRIFAAGSLPDPEPDFCLPSTLPMCG